VFDVGREDKDPIEPFSLFGTVYKKYVIEVFDESGRQIIGRKKGFTAEACVDVVSEKMQRFRVSGGSRTVLRDEGSVGEGREDRGHAPGVSPGVPKRVFQGCGQVRERHAEEHRVGV
jgi:hypothetical protein